MRHEHPQRATRAAQHRFQRGSLHRWCSRIRGPRQRVPRHAFDRQACCEGVAELPPPRAGRLRTARRQIRTDRLENGKAGQRSRELGELVLVRTTRQCAEAAGDFLQAQDVEIADPPRLVERAREVHVARGVASPLDIPADQSHRQISVAGCGSSTISPSPNSLSGSRRCLRLPPNRASNRSPRGKKKASAEAGASAVPARLL